MNSPKVWSSVDVIVLPQVAEIVSSALWDAAAQGIETVAETEHTTHLRAFFETAETLPELESTIRMALEQFEESPTALLSLQVGTVENQDWLENWKKTYSCVPIGQRWLIVPSWRQTEAHANPDWSDRFWIEIDPGMAFGTGTHETTQLCLELLETVSTPVQQVLDVGTGTGILAFAAAKLFPSAVIDACDNDPEAIQVATENLEKNGLVQQVRLRTASVGDYPAHSYDVTLANLTADVITPLAEGLVRSLRPGGCLIVSGILDFQIEAVRDAIVAAGGRNPVIQAAGEWRALLIEN
ncbi:MAG: 50S ribosomal protein L11 methyltransferase [Blastocatellia bacterium]|nr:50S ribosomal protein L11 methyltransferase [Blastocatellia bacterium]